MSDARAQSLWRSESLGPVRLTLLAGAAGIVCGLIATRSLAMGAALLVGLALAVVGVMMPMLTWQASLVFLLLVSSYVPTLLGGLVLWGSFSVFVIGCWLEHWESGRRIDWISPTLWVWIALWMMWGVVSLLHALDPSEGIKELTRYAISFGVLLTWINWVRTPAQIRKTVEWTWGLMTLVGVGIVLQLIGQRIIPRLSLMGPYAPTPGDIAMMITPMLPLAATLWLSRTDPQRWRGLLPLVIVLVGMYGCQSRSADLGSAVGILVGMWCLRPQWRGRLIGLSLAGAALIAAALLIKYGDLRQGLILNLSGRNLVWTAALHAIREHPLVGIGPGSWRLWLEQHYVTLDFLMPDLRGNTYVLSPDLLGGEAHSLYLTKAAEMGVPSLIGLIGILVAWAGAVRRAMSRIPEGWLRAAAIGSIASTTGMIVYGFFEHGPIIGRARGGEVLVVWMVMMLPMLAARATQQPGANDALDASTAGRFMTPVAAEGSAA